MLRHLGGYACRHWHEADNGIWEPRGERRHYTHTRLMCWVAPDRLAPNPSWGESAAAVGRVELATQKYLQWSQQASMMRYEGEEG